MRLPLIKPLYADAGPTGPVGIAGDRGFPGTCEALENEGVEEYNSMSFQDYLVLLVKLACQA